MKCLRFHRYGEPADVLMLDDAPVPKPMGQRIRVKVYACGLTPADWALCRGLFPGSLPRGIGLEAAGTVDAVAADVVGVAVGDRVFGATDYVNFPSAGASEYAILNHWAPMPAAISYAEAAALPMAVETAYRSLGQLGVEPGKTVLIHGAGTTVGFAAVQMALERGAAVIATAGDTHTKKLEALGVRVTTYGPGVADRVREMAHGDVDLALDTAPVNVSVSVTGALPDLVRTVGGEARRVLTIVDFAGAAKLGVRTSFDDVPIRGNGMPEFDDDAASRAERALRYDVLGKYAKLSAEGRFSVPISASISLEDWRDALRKSLSGHARGKLILIPGGREAATVVASGPQTA